MDYWFECISEAFNEHGIVATKEQIQSVADDVKVANENHGTACGYDAIPNPRDAEIDKLKQQLKKMEANRDQAELDFKKNVAMRRGCQVQDVSLDGDGHVTIHR